MSAGTEKLSAEEGAHTVALPDIEPGVAGTGPVKVALSAEPEVQPFEETRMFV